jgi:hypothetical protein
LLLLLLVVLALPLAGIGVADLPLGTENRPFPFDCCLFHPLEAESSDSQDPSPSESDSSNSDSCSVYTYLACSEYQVVRILIVQYDMELTSETFIKFIPSFIIFDKSKMMTDGFFWHIVHLNRGSMNKIVQLLQRRNPACSSI